LGDPLSGPKGLDALVSRGCPVFPRDILQNDAAEYVSIPEALGSVQNLEPAILPSAENPE
jgi:hypothetical protein